MFKNYCLRLVFTVIDTVPKEAIFIIKCLFIDNMAKVSWRPGTMVYPLPAALVTCGADREEWNMLTVAWTGTICSDPAMCYISVRPERHSYPIIRDRMEFTINLTTADMARATGEKVASPTIEESPLSIECRVKSIVSLGSHDMFIAEVLNVRADDKYIDPETGRFSLESSGIMAYSHGNYYELGKLIGKFGFSVQKRK